MGGKSGGNEAALARQDEQQRQAKIRAGTARINSIFDGAKAGSGALSAGTAYDPNATYYLADGSVWSPSTGTTTTGGDAKGMFSSGLPLPNGSAKSSTGGMFGAGGPLPNGSASPNGVSGLPGVAGSAPGGKTAEQQFAEMLSGGKLYSGASSTGGGFDDAFYGNRRQAYVDYAQPQLDQQYADAQKELTYALARNGTLDSSVRGEKTGELKKLYDLNSQKVADDALSYETDARNAVESARADLISTLNATGDAEGAANSALARSAALSQPAAFSPLASLFVDFTNALGTQAAANRADYYASGAPSAGGGATIYNRSNKAVKVS